MFVYKSKPRNHWISPYTMLDYVFFWTDWSRRHRNTSLAATLEDEARIMRGEKSTWVERPEWTDKWSDYLTPVSRAIQWVLDWVHPEINIVKIHKSDTWSMDHTLTPIILPMLKQLKATKHGSPFVDDEDVPDHLKSTAAPPKENDWDTDDNHHDRWDWVMSEMIFAFEHKADDSWQDEFRSGNIDFVSVPIDRDGNEVPKGEHDYYRMDRGPNDTYVCDYDGMRVVELRIQNGFRLFGKYFQSLWD